MNPSLREIDFVQVREVLQRKRYGRRVGNTTAQIMLMIANALVSTKTSHFLFVGEASAHVYDIRKTTVGYLEQLGFEIERNSGNQIVSRYYNENRFTFLPANDSLPCMIRGTRYDKAFIDLMSETKFKYARQLDEIKYHLYPY